MLELRWGKWIHLGLLHSNYSRFFWVSILPVTLRGVSDKLYSLVCLYLVGQGLLGDQGLHSNSFVDHFLGVPGGRIGHIPARFLEFIVIKVRILEVMLVGLAPVVLEGGDCAAHALLFTRNIY